MAKSVPNLADRDPSGRIWDKDEQLTIDEVGNHLERILLPLSASSLEVRWGANEILAALLVQLANLGLVAGRVLVKVGRIIVELSEALEPGGILIINGISGGAAGGAEVDKILIVRKVGSNLLVELQVTAGQQWR